jgi:hypothetical protein
MLAIGFLTFRGVRIRVRFGSDPARYPVSRLHLGSNALHRPNQIRPAQVTDGSLANVREGVDLQRLFDLEPVLGVRQAGGVLLDPLACHDLKGGGRGIGGGIAGLAVGFSGLSQAHGGELPVGARLLLAANGVVGSPALGSGRRDEQVEPLPVSQFVGLVLGLGRFDRAHRKGHGISVLCTPSDTTLVARLGLDARELIWTTSGSLQRSAGQSDGRLWTI